MKAKTKAKPAPAETEPLVPENIDKYVEVACSVVAALGDFLRDHYDTLTHQRTMKVVRRLFRF